jgi:hypothetical protein
MQRRGIGGSSQSTQRRVVAAYYTMLACDDRPYTFFWPVPPLLYPGGPHYNISRPVAVLLLLLLPLLLLQLTIPIIASVSLTSNRMIGPELRLATFHHLHL